MKRRRFILAAMSATVAGIAGCTGDDGGSGGDSENGGDNGGDSGNGGDNGGDSGNGGDGTVGPVLAESVQWENSFIAEFTGETQMGEAMVTIRFNDGNIYQTIESEQGTAEIYSVDNDIYIVQEGQCLVNPGQAPTSDVNPEDQRDVAEEYPDLTPAGRDTIDGEEMYVYEYNQDGQTATMYVSVESNYPRRVETPESTVDYHSWGEVDPISPPEMDCQEIGGGGGGGGGGGEDGSDPY